MTATAPASRYLSATDRLILEAAANILTAAEMAAYVHAYQGDLPVNETLSLGALAARADAAAAAVTRFLTAVEVNAEQFPEESA